MPTQTLSRPDPDHTSAPPQPVKVLLVDDNEENLVALEAALAPLGEETYSARSGQDALRLCLEHDFGAILLDVRMPEMDGFETAQLIRARPRSRHTPILFLTAYRSDEHLFRGYDLGAVDFLFKPIVPEILQSKVLVFVSLSRNAELLKQQAASLARAERQLRGLIEAAPDAMLITRRDGKIVIANSRAQSLFDLPRQDLLSADIRGIVPAWHAPDPPDIDDDLSDPAEQVVLRVTASRRDGNFPADITMSLFRSEDDWLVTTAVRDMTDAVRAERRLMQLNLELESKVAERTNELTRSNEALRQFAWAASHDLQEPLRMIASYSEWLGRTAKQKLTERERQYLETVQGSSLRMENLLASLRQYLLVNEPGTAVLQTVDCRKVLDEVVERLSGLLNENSATVEAGPLPVFQAVEVLMDTVFQNLISNAIRYRSDRPPRIKVTAERKGHEWIFSVADNGVGIESKYFEYVFGAFKRLQRDSGAGMGLAICKASVERLGGRIWIESEYGTGSTVHFSLPAGGTI